MNEEKVMDEELKTDCPGEEQPETQAGEEGAEAENNAEGAEAGSEEKTEETKAEDEDLQTKYLRLAADFQNYRRRTEKEKNDIYAYANEKFASGLLDVIDNFDRAMEHKGDADDKFVQGMELILKQLQSVLEKNRVTEIEALGKEFDPVFHNAVMTEEAGEGVESGTITKVFQKGYMLNTKVIRPAMVAVAQ